MAAFIRLANSIVMNNTIEVSGRHFPLHHSRQIYTEFSVFFSIHPFLQIILAVKLYCSKEFYQFCPVFYFTLEEPAAILFES